VVAVITKQKTNHRELMSKRPTEKYKNKTKQTKQNKQKIKQINKQSKN
jgi:hypothetical protein